MENANIKKINTAGLVGYILSIILIAGAIVAMVGIVLCTVGAITISDNNINVKIATNVEINSTGNFLEKIGSFISIDGIDLNKLTEDAKDGIKVNDEDLSELQIQEKDNGLVVNAKTNEITISMKRIIVALIAALVLLGFVTYALFTAKALMKALKDCETPFSEEVIKRMTKFSYAIICVVVLNPFLSGFWSSLTTKYAYTLNINIESILLVAIIYILIVVFKYGAKLQQESDETL